MVIEQKHLFVGSGRLSKWNENTVTRSLSGIELDLAIKKAQRFSIDECHGEEQRDRPNKHARRDLSKVARTVRAFFHPETH